MKRAVIVAAAKIKNYSKIRKFLSKDDFYIFCDAGLKHCKKLKVKPDLIVGDFDSIKKPSTSIETIVLPVEKDDADTFFAVKEALKRGFTNFLLLGCIGERFDHSLCNVSVLLHLYSRGAECVLIDDYSKMKIVGEKPIFVADTCSYFSLMNVDGNASGITIKNAKYELNNGEIKSDFMYGSGNEVLPGKKAEISVKKGRMLLVEIF